MKTQLLQLTPSTRVFTVPASVPAYLGAWQVSTGAQPAAKRASVAFETPVAANTAVAVNTATGMATAAGKAAATAANKRHQATTSTIALPARQGSSPRRSPV